MPRNSQYSSAQHDTPLHEPRCALARSTFSRSLMCEPALPALSECRCHSTAEWNNVRPAATMDSDAQTVIARQGTGGGISAGWLSRGHARWIEGSEHGTVSWRTSSIAQGQFWAVGRSLIS